MLHASRIRSDATIEVHCKNANKKETTSTMKLVDVASMVSPYVCPLVHPSLPPVHCHIPLYSTFILRLVSSLSLFSHTKRTNFPSRFRRFPSSFSVLLSFSLSFSLSRANISPSAASSSDRIEESSETAAISAEIESQNGENDCECFPLCRRESVKERGKKEVVEWRKMKTEEGRWKRERERRGRTKRE